jgi:cytochrome c5
MFYVPKIYIRDQRSYNKYQQTLMIQDISVYNNDTVIYAEIFRINLDIDAPHPASATPQARPSASSGQAFLGQVPPAYRRTAYLRSHSPAEAWQALRKEPTFSRLSDQQVWDMVAALWQSGTTPENLEQGQALYTQNCAACHGQDGAGGGVFANQAPARGIRPALLQGKILRGGMGTGMPYWGPIFTEDQTWAIVDYLYTFQFANK